MHKSAWSLAKRASASTADLDAADTSGTDSNSSLSASTSDSDLIAPVHKFDPGVMMVMAIATDMVMAIATDMALHAARQSSMRIFQ